MIDSGRLATRRSRRKRVVIFGIIRMPKMTQGVTSSQWTIHDTATASGVSR